MKIRTDFVTNSSSSSFVTFTINNPVLARIVEKYDSYMLCVKGDVISGEECNDDLGLTGTIQDGRIANWLADLLEYYNENYSDGESAEEDCLIDEIRTKAYKINKSTVKAEVTYADVVTDGDGTSGFHTVINGMRYVTTEINCDVVVDNGQTLYEAIVTNGEGNPMDLLQYLDKFGTSKSGDVIPADDEDEFDKDDLEEDYFKVVENKTAVYLKNTRLEITEDEAKGVWLTKKDVLGNYHITRYKGVENVLFVPGKIGKKEISMVGLYASVNDMISSHNQKTAIKKIVISDGIKYIGKYAFANLYNLREVNLPDTVTYISPLAFYGCSYMPKLRLGKSYADEIVDYIGHYDGTILKNSSFSIVRNEEYNIYEEHHSLRTEDLKYYIELLDGKLQPKPNSATKYVIVEDDLYTDAVKFRDFIALRKAGKCINAKAILASEFLAYVRENL